MAWRVLRLLVQKRGVKGLFCDYRELLKSIQNSYNPPSRTASSLSLPTRRCETPCTNTNSRRILYKSRLLASMPLTPDY
jgi:hypothetical protein